MILPQVKIRPSRGLLHLDLSTVWQYRELIFILVWRDIKVRYKQTVLGAAWAIFQPLAIMLIFTAVFSYVGKILRRSSLSGVPLLRIVALAVHRASAEP